MDNENIRKMPEPKLLILMFAPSFAFFPRAINITALAHWFFRRIYP